MQTELPTQPIPVQSLLLPPPTADAPAAPRRGRVVALVVAVLALLVGAAATVALLPGDEPDPVAVALDRLRQWPSTTVDGHLAGAGEPLRLHATVTADGPARGTLGRSRDATAEFAVGPDGALLRANAAWWFGRDAGRATLLADRWVSDAHEDAVDQVARGRLAPAALADTLAGLRNPDERTEAEVVVGGVPGRSYVRDGLRLVVGRDGAPLALTAPVGAPRTGPVGFRAGPLLDGATSTWTATVALAPPDPADGDTVRRAVADAARAAVSSSAGSRALNTAEGITITAVPLPGGCPRTGCTLRYHVANRGPAPATGTFTLRLDGELVMAMPLTVPAGGTVDISAEVTRSVLAAHPQPRLKLDAAFRPDDGPTS